MKKWLVAGLVVGLGVTMVGCSESSTSSTSTSTTTTETNKDTTAKEVTQQYFAELKKGDLEQARNLSEDTTFGGRYTETDLNSDGLKQAKEIVTRMDAEVGAETVKGDEATVDVKITSLDMTKIMGTAMKDVLGDAVSTALSGGADKADSAKKAKGRIDEAIQDPNAPKATSEVKVHLVKTKDGWRVAEDNSDLIQAMFGNPLK